MATTRLALQDVSVKFSDTILFNRVNLEIRGGERVVFIGPSGAGKSTLLKLFAGLLAPTSGQVVIEGDASMGMLFQKNALFDSLSVLENVAFALRERENLPEDEIQKKARTALERVGLEKSFALAPSEISGGMQKRLGIARAVVLEPELIFYDEPTAGLDPITSRHIAELILELNREQESTALIVTSELARAYQLADRIVMVVDGELIVTGSREETKRHSDPRVHQFVTGSSLGPLTEDWT